MRALLSIVAACLAGFAHAQHIHGPIAPRVVVAGGGGASFTDDFNRGILGPDWAAISSLGNWGDSANTLQVGAGPGPNFFDVLYYVGGVSIPANQFAQITVVTVADSPCTAEIGVRVDSSGQGYFGTLDKSGNWSIYKTISGSDTTLTSGSRTGLTNGDVLRMEANGTALTFKVNGATVGTTTDSARSSGTVSVNVFILNAFEFVYFDNASGGSIP